MASFPADPTPLTSGNTRVKNARKLARRSFRADQRLFLADGPKAVEGALSVPGCVAEVFATPAAAQEYAALRDAASEWTIVDDRALESMSDAVHPQGIVALCRFVDRPLEHVLSGQDPLRLVAICADVRDPGNAGAVIRTADAAGAGAVVLAGTSVDPYNPKTVRATVGSLFHVPLAVTDDSGEAVRAAHAAGLVVLAADGKGEVGLDDAIDTGLLTQPTAWLFGNEAWGLPAAVAGLADAVVRLPIYGRAESLNLATAAAVCLYTSARAQRR